MPNTKSAKKRLKQSLRRRDRNRSMKSSLKTLSKRVRSAAESGDLTKAGEELRAAQKRLDQAAAKGIIHRNAAARSKSRLSAALKAKKQAAAG